MMNTCEKLEQTVNTFCNYIYTLPDAEKVEQIWGPKEILAHLVQFHENFADQAEALLVNTLHQNLQGRFDDINAQAVKDSRGVTVDTLVQRFRSADKRLRHCAQTCDAEALPVCIKAGSKPQSLASVITMVEHHIRSHHQKLIQGDSFTSHADKLAQTVNRFCTFFKDLPESTRATHEAHFRTVVCPLVFWHENAVIQAEATVRTEISRLPAGRVSDLQEAAIKRNQDIPFPNLIDRLKTANQRIQDLAELHDPDSLAFEIRKNNGSRTFTGTIANLETNVRRRLIELKRFVKQL
ncbi:MAG: hypothetical protein AAF629_10375 [Chloroflexota bacterium]